MVHLVHFDAATAFAAKAVALRPEFTNLLEHAPRGFVGDSGLKLNLLCRNAATSASHQVHRMKPDSQCRAGLLEDRPGRRVDVIPARLTSVSRAALHAVVFARFLALVAHGYAAREALLFDLLKAGIVGWEIFFKLLESVAKFGGNGLSAIHGKKWFAICSPCYISAASLYVRGIAPCRLRRSRAP